ncbi:MAG: biliverdin-producing heme oxygenase [Corynebacterium sp.]|nr:biliverdin-producing heme oxygenase [Corynebacterium sp.]
MTTAVREFAQELHDATAAAHERAENSTFIADLIEGRQDAQAFIRLQEQAWLFYQALEETARTVRANTSDPVIRQLLDPRLERTATLEHDLDQLHGGSEWRDEITALPATQRYVSRLQGIGEAPELVAHHYVRYLGDLSGGQVIATMMRRHYDVPAAALTFYEFPELGKLKPYKDQYRKLLNALEFDDAEYDRALSEAGEAFSLNAQVFQDLC